MTLNYILLIEKGKMFDNRYLIVIITLLKKERKGKCLIKLMSQEKPGQ